MRLRPSFYRFRQFSNSYFTLWLLLTCDSIPPLLPSHATTPLPEIHTLVGAGSAEGGIDAANMLKPALARGKLQVIGATTISEYRKYIEKDAALERRLQPLLIKEPTIDQTVAILEAISDKYGAHHGVRYTRESLVAAAKLSERYITDRFLPDKVCMWMHDACLNVITFFSC